MKFNIDFLKNRMFFFAASSLLIIGIILSSVFMGVDLDIEFKGGAIITYSYEQKPDMAKLENDVETVLGGKVTVQESVNAIDNQNNIVISFADSISPEKQNELTQKLTTEFEESNIVLGPIKNVDASIGADFFSKAMVAIGFAFILMIIYIAIRFKKIGGWSAGVFAIVALLHDMLFIFGTFVVFRIPLDGNFVAVVLTILGYSVNDAIVIYDRIRENKGLSPRTPIYDLVNKSMNETLTRSLFTQLATLIAMVVVMVVSLFFGITSIITFAVPMVVGMLSGCYTTLFVTCPLWVMWQERKLKAHKKKKA